MTDKHTIIAQGENRKRILADKKLPGWLSEGCDYMTDKNTIIAQGDNRKRILTDKKLPGWQTDRIIATIGHRG
jgi:hypothetical protein